MSESADYKPMGWEGHNFDSAYAAYQEHTGRGYGDPTSGRRRKAKASSSSSSGPKALPDAYLAVPDKLLCLALRLVTFWMDFTGSMSDWPAEIFKKLPFFEHECKYYLGEDTLVAFGGFGDANGSRADRYPLQLRPAVIGPQMAEELKHLDTNCDGGGQIQESSELAALYSLHNIETPKAIRKPIIIIVTDENPYPTVNVDQARKFAKVELKGTLTTKQLFKDLTERFAVYVVLKPYGSYTSDGQDSTNRDIYETWAKLVGKDHLAILPEPARINDVVFGILAKEEERLDDFQKELTGRQTKAQVKTVYQSLKTIMAVPAAPAQKALPAAGHSRLHAASDAPKTKPLL